MLKHLYQNDPKKLPNTNMTALRFDDAWKKLSSSVQQVFQMKKMTLNEFMECRKTVHDYYKSEEYENSILEAHKSKSKTNQQEEEIPGGTMYFTLKNFVVQLIETEHENIRNYSDEDYVRVYLERWEIYVFGSRVIGSMFQPMNDTWVRRHKDSKKEDKDSVKEIFPMMVVLWKERVFDMVSNQIKSICLSFVERDRLRTTVDTTWIQKIVQSLLSLDALQAETSVKKSSHSRLALYQNYLEEGYINSTRDFYEREFAKLKSENSIMNSLRKIKGFFDEERKRCEQVLHVSTIPKVLPILDGVLVDSQLDVITEEGRRIIESENSSDLSVLFSLIKEKPIVVDKLVSTFKAHTKKVTTGEIESLVTAGTEDAKVYIETIIKLYNRFSDFLNTGCKSDGRFLSALEYCFFELVNNNAVTRKANQSKKSAELLAQYSDMILRKGEKGADQDVETKLNEIISVFKYIEDKDAFQAFYGRFLAKRLINQSSASDDHEESMILKLKNACGFEYASKLQRMYQDIRLSAELCEQYQTAHPKKPNQIDLTAKVLSTNLWSFSPQGPLTLTREMEGAIDRFTAFYLTKHEARKLNWLHHLSKCDVITLYTKPKYTLQVSTYQALLSLQFNEGNRFSIKNLTNLTNIDMEKCANALIPFLKKKLFKCSHLSLEASAELKEDEIKENFEIELVENFRSTNVRINLLVQPKTMGTVESKSINAHVEEERRYITQAVIVRTMKSRKEMEHSELVQEILPQLAKRFKPDIAKIKKVIEGLIDSEYIRRGDSRTHYHYIA